MVRFVYGENEREKEIKQKKRQSSSLQDCYVLKASLHPALETEKKREIHLNFLAVLCLLGTLRVSKEFFHNEYL